MKEEQPGGLWDRQGNHFLIFDIDGTREAARQRALPNIQDRPSLEAAFAPALCPRLPWAEAAEKSCAPAPQSYRLHHQLACLRCVREHRCIGRPSFLPLGVQFICPPQVDIEMLYLRHRKSMDSLSHKMPCLLVEGEGIAQQRTPAWPHRLRRYTSEKAGFLQVRQSGRATSAIQPHRRRICRLQTFAMHGDGSYAAASLHLPQRGRPHGSLRMSEHIASNSHACCPLLHRQAADRSAASSSMAGSPTSSSRSATWHRRTKATSPVEDGSCRQVLSCDSHPHVHMLAVLYHPPRRSDVDPRPKEVWYLSDDS